MITSSDFNKRITFQMDNAGVDDDGYVIEGKANVLSCWACIKTVSAKEYQDAKATQSENIARFVIRYRKNVIKSNMTILYNGRTFNIESIINDNEENVTLTIIGREVVMNG